MAVGPGCVPIGQRRGAAQPPSDTQVKVKAIRATQNFIAASRTWFKGVPERQWQRNHNETEIASSPLVPK